MSTLTEIIEKINEYITRYNSDDNYQGSHEEQLSLQEIKDNFGELCMAEQKLVRQNFSFLYNHNITSSQKLLLDQSNKYLIKAATIGAMSGAVGGITLGAGLFKSVLATGFCAFGATFFANRHLHHSHKDLALLKKKVQPFNRIQAIIGDSIQSDEVKLLPVDLSEVRRRRRVVR